MSQNSMNIPGGLGANFRANLNLALAALASNSSGVEEPTVKFAHMWWPDLTSGWVKQRNADNTSWIKRFPIGSGARIDVVSVERWI